MSLGVILFASTHFAILAEKLAKEKGCAVKLIPVPRQLSSDCGVCLRFSWDQKKEIEEALNQAGVRMESIHCVD
jgi:hypothetical protein